MKASIPGFCALACALASPAAAQVSPAGAPPARPDPPLVRQHVEKARVLARDEFAFFHNRYCNPFDTAGRDAGELARSRMVVPPTRTFDNLYYVGMASVGAWALTTSEGIIVFDALNNADEAERYIAGGLRRLGLDPARIRYVVIMHGHGDHFGGANHLKAKYGARLMTSAADWEFMQARKADRRAPAKWRDLTPERDLVIGDGQTLTLGDTSVRFHLTPGHTPATVSALVPVREKGRLHTAAFWGGTAFPRTPEALAQYEASVRRFWGIATDAKADVLLSNHPFLDNTLDNIARLPRLRRGEANPFVIGRASYATYMGVLHECTLAAQARLAGP